ncbi:MAG: class I SAM-dependent methyltransferase [Flavobacteriales bacterium]
MQSRHVDRTQYFREQDQTTRKFVIPYIGQFKTIDGSRSIVEIGCGEGGNLVAFLETDCKVTGIDIVQSRIDKAHELLDDHPRANNLHLICDDMYNRTSSDGKYDVLIMRDVIEHIHNQEKFMGFVKQFMTKESVFFLAFPPWYNPFGGHQQICRNRFLSKLPYYHILPTFLYKTILKAGGESQKTIDDLIEIKQTGITIERFERILKKEGFTILKKTHYLFNPNYETKFGLKPRVIWDFPGKIPFVRNFFITAGYYLIAKV